MSFPSGSVSSADTYIRVNDNCDSPVSARSLLRDRNAKNQQKVGTVATGREKLNKVCYCLKLLHEVLHGVYQT